MEPVYYAVPSKSLLVISEEKAKEILEECKNAPPLTKEEKEARRKRARALFTKPEKPKGRFYVSNTYKDISGIEGGFVPPSRN